MITRISEIIYKQFRLVSVLAIICFMASTATAYVEDFYVVVNNGIGVELNVAANDGSNPPTHVLRVIEQPTNGIAQPWNGAIQYLPNSGFYGFDTLRYDYPIGFPPYPATRVRILVVPNDDAINAGEGCGVGEPVNVTNGNMWLKQRDYLLPGLGDPIEITRFYNSITQANGLYGSGWTTKYDESLTIYPDGKMLRYISSDGRATFFGRLSTSDPFTSFSPQITGNIVLSPGVGYTLTFKDGRKLHFSTAGKLEWLKDSNGNQTTLSYDTNGDLEEITDAAGREVSISTNASGNITQISDTTSIIATYEYYPSTNQLMTVTYNDGSKYEFEYDITTTPGKVLLTTVKDALNNILETHDYDSQGRATTSERHGGVEKYTLAYNQTDPTHGTFTNVTDANNNVTKYFFTRESGTNLITRIEGACSCSGGSQVKTFEYDTNLSWLNLTKTTDGLGREVTYSYDSNRNVTEITDVLGTQTFTYNSLGQVLTYRDRVDSQGSTNTQENTYDANGNLLTTKDALNNATTMTYTTNGQLASVTDARSNTTTFTYDTHGRLTQITDANSKNTNFAYDARARVTSFTNALSQTTSFEYDLNNRIKKVTYPDTNFVEYTYDLAGRRTAFKDARGNTTNYNYDNAYRLTGIVDQLNNATTYGYDLMSNLTSITDALGNVTDLEYDEFNRLEKIIYPEPASAVTRLEETITYDLVGNVKTRVDTAGRTTGYDYDTSNRLIKITDALNNITQFEYNARSHMTKVKDALNQEYVFTYDPLGRVLSQTRAGTNMTFEYDAVGNRTKRTDYNGTITNYTYDNLNRLMSGPLGTYTYDDLSRLLTAVNGAGTVSFTYDNRGRTKSTTDVYNRVIEYDYDENGNRTLLKLDSVNYSGYVYDAANRLTSINDLIESVSIGFTYDNADRLTGRTYPNGVTRSIAYDGMSRLKNLLDEHDKTTLQDKLYSYNNANQISQISEPGRLRMFSYDNLDRLTAVADSVLGSESYVYDAVGNRTSSHLSNSYTYGSFNRLTATQQATYTYDNNGAMISRTDASGTISFTHDSDGRLVSSFDDQFNFSQYGYDALGRRVSFLHPHQLPHQYTYDGHDVLVSYYGGLPTRYQNGPGIDNKLSTHIVGSSPPMYHLQDHLGTTFGTTNNSGAFSSAGISDSFGSPGGIDFTGREYDSFNELYYYRARMYDPQLGRFISEDPIGFNGGDINLYGYVGNNPLNFIDPFGHSAWGSNFANWLDRRIAYAEDYWSYNDQEWVANGVNRTVADVAYGFSDMFRVGTGIGQAMYCQNLPDYRRFELVANDIVRGGGLFLTMAAPIGGRFGTNGSGRFPNTPEAMDDILGFSGRRVPDGPGTPGRGKVEWKPSDKVKITYEQHPYHPNAPKYHRDPHWHVAWPGKRHARYLPGDKFPGL